ncbi:hypothetical protein NLG97_g6568 [Lecanicillium saksenae]|uniref:Uncharacterized protein n=1 Tax=Lecanicillium saksenae TaxID=468837 RepID=A0ACC1QPE4_9HYPO|nr:hypothetical protein NLG97_g6568 [Lecanicillium saksenae]
MLTDLEIEQKTRAAWNKAQSFDEIRALSQFYMEQSRDQKFCTTPYDRGPMSAEQCDHIDTLIRLQSYGIIPLGGVDPTGIYWEQIDGEYVHTRQVSDLLFLIRRGGDTERFLDKIKNDKRLNKQVKDSVSGTDVCIIKDGPITIQRKSTNAVQLLETSFAVIDAVCGAVSLEDCCLEEVGAITSTGVYICRVLLAMEKDDFMTAADLEVAKKMQSLHLLQTIENYAQETVPQAENGFILPPYTSLENLLGTRSCILDELEWTITTAPGTARHNDKTVVLSKQIFKDSVKLIMPNRYRDIGEERSGVTDVDAVDVVEIDVVGKTLHDILLSVWQRSQNMDEAAGRYRHGDKTVFEGLQQLKEHTWLVNIS